MLHLFPGNQGIVRQIVCETDGFDVFLDTRRYHPLVTPEFLSLQIRFHRHEDVLNLHQFWVRDLGYLLAVLSSPVHDPVEEGDELF